MATLALTQSAPRARRPEGARTGDARSRVVACGVAWLVGACVLASGWTEPLPAFGWAAAFVFLAVERDVRERRIPNWLTFPAFGLALLYAGLTGSLVSALVGAAVALALLVLPWIWGWFGAGDVKAMMVLGALWGVGVLLPVLAWAILVGGVVAVGWLAVRRDLGDFLARWWGSLVLTLSNRRWTYLPPASGSAAARGIPFAVNLGLAIAAYQLWGTPWS